ncbi:DUF4396 domain-containing protein [Streptomyces sp. TRM 70361]|uniref:DUF4396 domain-containing protein n=1 Tax=Streptomyces sp. TRM 70361 TaxID=3116553 RepID=UPI002E7C1C3B|nr:DUF4396 domain-containing protein [Streptomyces sp. TRM 70361]MEE1942458.1 DUF4396 domain-containing protein [Streptomyces sp. TRM 70361]
MSSQSYRSSEGHHGHHGHTGHMEHAGHAEHTGHPDPAGRAEHGEHTVSGTASWATAAKATLHCLTGCAFGEVLGMVIGTALGWHTVPTMALAIVLAFLFGYSFTLWAVLRAGVGLRNAVRVALAADTVSITVMELVDNGVIALTPGALDAHLSDWLFWGALAFAFAVAFVVTTPVNRWLIGRGRGHAVVHRYH